MTQPVRPMPAVVVVLTCLVTVVTVSRPTSAADPKGKKDDAAATSTAELPANLTVAQKRFLRTTERKLVTKYNSKDNPGDRDTWYALIFRDEVQARAVSGGSSTITITSVRASVPDGVVVQGKQEAALAIGRFYARPNAAVKLAQGAGIDPRTAAVGGDAVKNWGGEGFRTRQEADAWLLRALPQKAKKK